MTEEVDRPYAGQEGEINDKLLLDLAWERQQKKVCLPAATACVRAPRERRLYKLFVLLQFARERARVCACVCLQREMVCG